MPSPAEEALRLVRVATPAPGAATLAGDGSNAPSDAPSGAPSDAHDGEARGAPGALPPHPARPPAAHVTPARDTRAAHPNRAHGPGDAGGPGDARASTTSAAHTQRSNGSIAHRDLRLPRSTRRILHLDIDAFLASVEQALHAELRGRPVVVGGMPTDRNLVMSCSYEARACGVRSGMMLAEAARRCPQAIFRRGDAQAANRLREATAEILLELSPLVEIASIDDFYVDLTGSARALGSAFDVAVHARERIQSEVLLPVTIGIGTNRTIARLAGKLAKPGGVAEILPGGEVAFLRALPIEHLPGAGHAIGRALERYGIRFAGELALVPREVMFASFGRLGLVLHERARGIDPEPVEPTYTFTRAGRRIERRPRSIRRDSTFEPEEGRREMVEAMLCYLVERAAHRLRRHDAVARSIAVRIQYVDTRPSPRETRADTDPTAAEKRAKLDPPSDATDALLARARELWRALPRRRALVKRIGITLDGLAASGGWQRNLFSEDGPTHEALETDEIESDAAREARGTDRKESDAAREARCDRSRRLDAAIDRLRERHGFGRILRGESFVLGATHELLPDGFRLRTPSLNQ